MYNFFLIRGGQCTISASEGGPMYNYFLRKGADLQFRPKKGGRCTIVF